MANPSHRDTVVGGIIAISTMAFLAGLFLMSGLHFWLRGDWSAALYFAMLPLFPFAIVLHAKRILAALPRQPYCVARMERSEIRGRSRRPVPHFARAPCGLRQAPVPPHPEEGARAPVSKDEAATAFAAMVRDARFARSSP